jgi:hypothetical protein
MMSFFQNKIFVSALFLLAIRAFLYVNEFQTCSSLTKGNDMTIAVDSTRVPPCMQTTNTTKAGNRTTAAIESKQMSLEQAGLHNQATRQSVITSLKGPRTPAMPFQTLLPAEMGVDPKRELHFITYGDDAFAMSRERLAIEAKSMKVFASVHAFSRGELELDDDFLRWVEPLKDVWNSGKGGGYWIWKPYVVNRTLHKIRERDVLVYADAGCICNRRGLKRFGEYIRAIDESRYGVLSFQMTHRESTWTTRQIFEALNLTTTSEHAVSNQYHSTTLIFVNNGHARDIVAKWLEFICEHKRLITDADIKVGQIKSFQDSRYDQSVFSLIRKIEGSVVRRDDTWTAGFAGEWNPTSGDAGVEALKSPFIGARVGNTPDSCAGLGRFVCNF